jgi:hypothetical protein
MAAMTASVVVGGAPTPITAVGARVIDASPRAVKDWVVRARSAVGAVSIQAAASAAHPSALDAGPSRADM